MISWLENIHILESPERLLIGTCIFSSFNDDQVGTYCIRAPSKRGRYWEIHLRPSIHLEGNLEDKGVGFPNNSRVLVEYAILFIIRECTG